MKCSILLAATGLASLTLAASSTTGTSLPTSTDAAAFLSDISATPAWATGQYATSLATALWSVETSFAGRDDYRTIVDEIWSAAAKDGGDDVVESISASYWNWNEITAAAWYTENVDKALQTEVVRYDGAYASAWSAVEAKATATGNAAAPRCTAMAAAAVAALGAAVAGML